MGLRSVFREDVALFDVVCALAAGERPFVKGDMADKVEGIEVVAEFLGDWVERQSLGLQFLDDRLLALGGLPAFQEIVEAGEAFLSAFLVKSRRDSVTSLPFSSRYSTRSAMMVAPMPST